MQGTVNAGTPFVTLALIVAHLAGMLRVSCQT